MIGFNGVYNLLAIYILACITTQEVGVGEGGGEGVYSQTRNGVGAEGVGNMGG